MLTQGEKDMKEQVLSIKQMEHLKELGVDTSKESCFWYFDDKEDYLFWGQCTTPSGVPTLTLQDMLEMIPGSIESDNILYHFELLKLGSCYSMGYKCIIYEKNGDNNRIEYLILVWDKNSLTCAYEILCWLAENKHIGGEK
jgi:hypothetical protein